LRASLDHLGEAGRARDVRTGVSGRENATASEVREALEAAESLRRAAESADNRRPGAVWRDAIAGLAPDALPEMVTLPRGRFLMGAAKGEPGSSAYELPQHKVRIGHIVALGKCAVTFAEWDVARAAGARVENPSDQDWGRDRRPVINVSWQDALAYLEWLNTELGLAGRLDAYRLPSEAEWEYACRAGTTTPFHFGGTISTVQANYARRKTTPVGSFPANAFGLHDMHGNVWEWCEDVWHANYEGAPTDGSAWIAGGVAFGRVFRGGGWESNPEYCRSAVRVRELPTFRNNSLGFRVARTILRP
jgi:formylglycine-generating enzyme required for sulfatase activity